MELENLYNDDSAVSPVIGVILMVAITVILAAVIASFVLGLGPDTATTPTATFDSKYEESSDTLTISMESGEKLDTSNLEIAGDFKLNGTTASDADNINDEGEIVAHDPPDEMTAGATIKVAIDSAVTNPEVRLVYVEGDTTSTMQTFEP